MAAFLVRRLLLTVSVLLAVSFAAFVGFGLSLDPSYPLVQEPQAQALVRRTYHLNDPILTRYWLWLRGLFHHGFGTTVSTGVSGTPPHFDYPGTAIGPALWHAAGISAALVGLALVLVAVGGAAVGAFASQRRRFRADLGVRAVAYLGAAVPTFLLADLIRRAIAPDEKVIFVHGQFTLTARVGWFLLGPPTGDAVDWLRHLFLPAATLALGLTGIYARYVRTAVMVELGKPYVVVARAKGLPEHRVLLRHALRNSLVPVVSLLTLEVGGIVGVSLAVDYVFGSGGLATVFIGALGHADPFELTAIVVTSAVVVSGFTLAGDVGSGLLDPRVRLRR